MITTLRKRAQFTLPHQVVKELDLREGDKFEVTCRYGEIVLTPVAIYPTEYIDELKKEVDEMREKISSGEKQQIIDDEDLFEILGI